MKIKQNATIAILVTIQCLSSSVFAEEEVVFSTPQTCISSQEYIAAMLNKVHYGTGDKIEVLSALRKLQGCLFTEQQTLSDKNKKHARAVQIQQIGFAIEDLALRP